MKLLIPSIDCPGESETICGGDIIKDLERKISEKYTVYPVMSDKAYEDFDVGDGAIGRLTHVVFGYAAPGRLTDFDTVHQLFLCVWEDVCRAWPTGATVMWRRRPEVREENNKGAYAFESGESSSEDTTPDDWRVIVTVRLGSFTSPKVQSVQEGGLYPVLGM